VENCKAIANYYGIDNQILIAIEEMSELTKELCKYERKFHREREIAEELADVSIMVEQLIDLFGVERNVSEIIDYKLNRQLRRIDNERE
jgi:NTP pyrophosphatase (non-canonical NTP hydrolase)